MKFAIPIKYDVKEKAMKLGKKGVILGVANSKSIAYGCAKALKREGCDLILTYANDKAKEYIQPLADELGVLALLKCDVRNDDEVVNLFAEIENKIGSIDFLIHSIAFADHETLHNRLIDSSWDGFSNALKVSCHSFLNLAKHAEKIMHNGGSLITMTYYGAEKVVDNYGVMGPIKACLEASVRYMATELVKSNIRVFAISPGPIDTRAASGLKDFDKIAQKAQSTSPMRRLVTTDEVGNVSVFLVSDLSTGMTGQTIYVDCGASVVW